MIHADDGDTRSNFIGLANKNQFLFTGHREREAA